MGAETGRDRALGFTIKWEADDGRLDLPVEFLSDVLKVALKFDALDGRVGRRERCIVVDVVDVDVDADPDGGAGFG